MKRILLVVVWCVLAFPTKASHIVGGEFEIQYIGNSDYRINLILYFDLKQGNPGAKDLSVGARIFSKRNNGRMEDVILFLDSTSIVGYNHEECSHGEIETERLVYTAVIKMTAAKYSDPEGYYIAWERCCRNYNITNVISNDPSRGQYAGQTFYLEFPPVVKDGHEFINSSPHLFPPLNDYACPGRVYYVAFGGTDADGDSLAYKIVTPLNTHTGDAIPANGPRPSPYDSVIFRSPFSRTNIMSGNPDLQVRSDGYIIVTPSMQGLFVFAVKCEEFRDGVKIGEVRRDFQMLVVDKCPAAEPPQIEGKVKGAPETAYKSDALTVSFNNAVTDEDRCIQVRIKDPDASKAEENFTEIVKVEAVPLNFKADVTGVLPTINEGTLINGDSIVFDICFPKCPYKVGSFDIGIVALDDACSLPLTDTLVVTVTIAPPTNTPPYITLADTDTLFMEGTSKTWKFQVKDDDGDPLIVGGIPLGFAPDVSGMTLEILNQQNGLVDAQFTWDTRCDVFDFTQKTNFEYWIFAEDIDECNLATPDITKLNLAVQLPVNSFPVIDSDLTPNPFESHEEKTVQPYDNLSFLVTGKDVDNDFIVLDVKGKGFNLDDYGIIFQPVDGNGSISSAFEWDIHCEDLDLALKDQFEFEFVVVDKVNRCKLFNTDTLLITVNIEPPSNTKPSLNIVSINPIHQLLSGSMDVKLGEQINLGLAALDVDSDPQDFIRIELIDIEGAPQAEGYVFAPGEGMGSAETTFSWNPQCSIFTDETRMNEYILNFRVYDNRCFSALGDTVSVSLNLSDVDADLALFVPPNIITPNGDHCNDYFAMEGYDSDCNEAASLPVHLPPDNCDRHFENIQIFNRWGKLVYQSNQRDFRWYAPGEASGVYFYYLKYSDRVYKGSVSVRY